MKMSFDLSRNTKGIALIQVLIIISIISLIAMFIIKSAQNNIKQAKLSTYGAKAELEFATAKSRLVLSLLSQLRLNKADGTELIKKWNFYGERFAVTSNVTAELVDHAGLLSLKYFDKKLVQQIFIENGIDPREGAVFSDSLLDWQDIDRLSRLNGAEDGVYQIGPRNAPVSVLAELAMVNGSESLPQKFLGNIFSLYRNSPFNPSTANELILAGLLGRDISRSIAFERKERQLTESQFSQISGLVETTEQIFYPGNVLEVRLFTKIDGIQFSTEMILELDPYASNSNLVVNNLEVLR